MLKLAQSRWKETEHRSRAPVRDSGVPGPIVVPWSHAFHLTIRLGVMPLSGAIDFGQCADPEAARCQSQRVRLVVRLGALWPTGQVEVVAVGGCLWEDCLRSVIERVLGEWRLPCWQVLGQFAPLCLVVTVAVVSSRVSVPAPACAPGSSAVV